MQPHSPGQLEARIEALEKQVADLVALLETFVSVDESTKDVTIDAEKIRCESMTVYQWWLDEDDDYQELDRVSIFVSDGDDEKATIRMWGESGGIVHDIEACDDSVLVESYHGKKLRLQSRADAEGGHFSTLHADGKTYASRSQVQYDKDGTFSGFRVVRRDATVAAQVGSRPGRDEVAVLDTAGKYTLVRLANLGTNLGQIEGWRSSDERWLEIGETDAGNGGRFCFWLPGAERSSAYILTSPKCSELGIGDGGVGSVAAINLVANDGGRCLNVFPIRGKVGVSLGITRDGQNWVTTDASFS
jgi:hypothetical protein